MLLFFEIAPKKTQFNHRQQYEHKMEQKEMKWNYRGNNTWHNIK